MPDLVSGQGAATLWEANPQQWDTLVVDGQKWPGVWEVDPSGVELDLDVKKAKGKHGSKKRNQGRVSPSAKLRGEITATEWSQLEPLLKRVLPAQLDGIVTPHTMDHPLLRLCDLSQVYVKKWRAHLGKGGKSFLEVNMLIVQFTPEPKEVKRTLAQNGGPDTRDLDSLTEEQLDNWANYGRNRALTSPFLNYGEPQGVNDIQFFDELGEPPEGS